MSTESRDRSPRPLWMFVRGPSLCRAGPEGGGDEEAVAPRLVRKSSMARPAGRESALQRSQNFLIDPEVLAHVPVVGLVVLVS